MLGKAHPKFANSLDNLAVLYNDLGEYEKAIEYEKQWLAIARRIKDRESEGKAVGNLGLVYLANGNYKKAIEHQRQWIEIAREIQDRQSESSALNNLGLALYKIRDLPASKKALLASIKIKESFRTGLDDKKKVSIFDIQNHSYLTLQQVLIAQNETDTALEISERGRARAFVELLTSRLNLSERPQPPSIEKIKQIAKAQNSTLVQ